MSKTKFTPGPWTVVRVGPRKHSKDERPLIQAAECNVCTLDVSGREYGAEMANAALIAAAPEMCAALHDAIADAEFALANDLAPQSCFTSWLPAAKEALAKAKGESR